MRPALSLLPAFACFIGACDPAADSGRAVGETASDRIELSAEAAEPILAIAVAEGVRVSRGDLLVQQDTARADAGVATAAADLAQARARLAELVRGPRSEKISAARANVAGAREELAFRQVEYERIQDVFERDLATAALRDQAEASLDSARANLDLYEAQLEELLTGTTVEELDQAEAAAAAASARLDAERVALDRLALRAPADGVTDSRLFEIGERPAAGQPVMIMLAGEQAYARVFVSEELRAQVGPGTAARVYIDGVDTPLDGRVRWVASEAAFTPYFALTERDRGRLSYAAKVDILGYGQRLPDGVPVEVEFLANTAGE